MRQILATAIHPDDAIDPAKRRTTSRHVTVNLAENAVGWLHARGLLNDVQALAGARLHADFVRSGYLAGTTMRWDAMDGGMQRTGRRGGARQSGRGGDAPTLAMIDARRRFDGAMAHAGRGLNDICWRIICNGETMGASERALGWPGRSGRVILGIALDRLAEYYRLVPGENPGRRF